MKLIAGLGNPGRIYIDSRHNIGFLALKRLSQVYRAPLKKEKGISSFSGKARIGREYVILAKPTTFMNLSGIAIKALLAKYKIDLANLLVVCDDLDLEFGRMRLKTSGSSGGHRGLDSIINSLGSQEFARLRIGIGRPDYSRAKRTKDQVRRYVLSSFSKKEKEENLELIKRGVECCKVWASEGAWQSMNIFNRRSIDNE